MSTSDEWFAAEILAFWQASIIFNIILQLDFEQALSPDKARHGGFLFATSGRKILVCSL
jgi:hypothetical protein